MVKRIVMADDVTGEFDGVVKDQLNTAYVGLTGVGSRISDGNVATGRLLPVTAADLSRGQVALLALEDGTLLGMYRKAANHLPSIPATSPPQYPGDIVSIVLTRTGVVLRAETVVRSESPLDARDPVLSRLSDGRIAVQYFVHDGTDHLEVRWITSDDEAQTWSEPATIPFGFTRNAACSGPVVDMGGGALIAAAYGRDTGDTFWSCRVVVSSDGGDTWGSPVTIADGEADSKNYFEPFVGMLPNGDVMALVRMDTGTKTITRIVSSDGGDTWGSPVGVLAGTGRPAWLLLDSGVVVICYRKDGADGARDALVSTSYDLGITWEPPVTLDQPDFEMAYAQLAEVLPGTVAVLLAHEDSRTSSFVQLTYLLEGNGISPLGDVSTGIGRSTPDRVRVPASAFSVVAGSPSLSQIASTGVAGWRLDATSPEAVAGQLPIPSEWVSFDVVVEWSATTSDTGAVEFFTGLGFAGAGDAMSTPYAASPAVAVAGASTLVASTVRSGVTNSPADLCLLRIGRQAAEASDTYPADAAIVAVVAVRTA